jgi:hypothetical protein
MKRNESPGTDLVVTPRDSGALERRPSELVDGTNNSGSAPSGGALVAQRLAEHLPQIASTLVSGYVEIRKIREQADAKRSEVEGEVLRIEAEMVREVKRFVEQRASTESRGQVVVDIIGAVTTQLAGIPDADREARGQAITNLPRLVELAIKG